MDTHFFILCRMFRFPKAIHIGSMDVLIKPIQKSAFHLHIDTHFFLVQIAQSEHFQNSFVGVGVCVSDIFICCPHLAADIDLTPRFIPKQQQ